MPIWLELLVLALVAYAAGLGIGWALWGRGEDGGQHSGPNSGPTTGDADA